MDHTAGKKLAESEPRWVTPRAVSAISSQTQYSFIHSLVQSDFLEHWLQTRYCCYRNTFALSRGDVHVFAEAPTLKKSTVEYYSAIKRNEVHAATQMYLENLMLNEIRQMQKTAYYVISIILNVQGRQTHGNRNQLSGCQGPGCQGQRGTRE